MNDDPVVNPDIPADTATEEAPCAPEAPKRKPRAKATKATKEAKVEPSKPEEEGQKPVADPLLFAMLLKTQRTMEREARSAKLSSMRIV
jgi:hypothetical protein